jgi:dihydroorotase
MGSPPVFLYKHMLKNSESFSNAQGTTVLNAEPRFLQHLVKLHKRFPKLRIVLEHATTSEAAETVKSLGETVACTITVHHLALTVDDWAGQNLHFCKPVAKGYDDRRALREVIASGALPTVHTTHRLK